MPLFDTAYVSELLSMWRQYSKRFHDTYILRINISKDISVFVVAFLIGLKSTFTQPKRKIPLFFQKKHEITAANRWLQPSVPQGGTQILSPANPVISFPFLSARWIHKRIRLRPLTSAPVGFLAPITILQSSLLLSVYFERPNMLDD